MAGFNQATFDAAKRAYQLALAERARLKAAGDQPLELEQANALVLQRMLDLLNASDGAKVAPGVAALPGTLPARKGTRRKQLEAKNIELRRKLAETQAELDAAKARIADKERRIAELEAEEQLFNETKAELEQARQALQKRAPAAAKQQISDLTKQVEVAEKRAAEAAKQLADATTELDTIKRNNALLLAENADLNEQLRIMEPLIERPGEVADEDDIERRLDILREGEEVEERGEEVEEAEEEEEEEEDEEEEERPRTIAAEVTGWGADNVPEAAAMKQAANETNSARRNKLLLTYFQSKFSRVFERLDMSNDDQSTEADKRRVREQLVNVVESLTVHANTFKDLKIANALTLIVDQASYLLVRLATGRERIVGGRREKIVQKENKAPLFERRDDYPSPVYDMDTRTDVNEPLNEPNNQLTLGDTVPLDQVIAKKFVNLFAKMGYKKDLGSSFLADAFPKHFEAYTLDRNVQEQDFILFNTDAKNKGELASIASSQATQLLSANPSVEARNAAMQMLFFAPFASPPSDVDTVPKSDPTTSTFFVALGERPFIGARKLDNVVVSAAPAFEAPHSEALGGLVGLNDDVKRFVRAGELDKVVRALRAKKLRKKAWAKSVIQYADKKGPAGFTEQLLANDEFAAAYGHASASEAAPADDFDEHVAATEAALEAVADDDERAYAALSEFSAWLDSRDGLAALAPARWDAGVARLDASLAAAGLADEGWAAAAALEEVRARRPAFS